MKELTINKQWMLESLVSFLLITFATGVVSLSLGQDANYDLKNYHFYNGYSFMTGRLGYDIAPAQIQTYLNPLSDVFVYLGISYLPAKLFGFIFGSLQGIGVWLIYKLTRILTDCYSTTTSIILSILSSVTAFSGAGWFSEIGTTFGDNVIGIFVIGAIILIVPCSYPLNIRENNYAFIKSSLLLGFATGIKLVAAVYFVGFLISITFLMDKNNPIKQYTAIIISFTIGLAASTGFWMIILWDKFESPLFPFYNKIFKSPYFALINFNDDRFFPRNVLQQLFYPFYFLRDSKLVCELEFKDFRIPFLYIVVFVLILWSLFRLFNQRNKDSTTTFADDKRTTYFLVFFCMFSYITWQFVFSVYRYAITIEMHAPVIIILVISTVIKGSRLASYSAMGVLCFAIVTVCPMSWGRVPWGKKYFSFSSTPFTQYENSTVLIFQDVVASYMIPFFPKSTKFIGVNSFTIQSGVHSKMQIEIENALRDSSRIAVLMTAPDTINPNKKCNINVNLESCKHISTSVGDSYYLCDATSKN